MIQYKRILMVLAAGMTLMAGRLWADNATPAAASTTPAAAAPAAKPAKAEAPTVTAMKAAIALEDAGNTTDAIAAFEKMGVLKTKSMECWRLNNEAHVYLMTNQPDKAVELLEKATATDDSNYIAWNNLGTAYEQTDAYDKAKDAYQKSIDAAKAANASSAKAEGNLSDLQARMDKIAAKKAKKNGGKAPAASTTPSAAPAAAATPSK
jgi:tetratricopeptide (TPR) repeat protein